MFSKALFQLWLLTAGVSGFSCPAALKNWQRRAPALQLSDRPTTDTSESIAESDSFDYEGAFKARVAEQTAAEREDTVVRRRLDRLTPEEDAYQARVAEAPQLLIGTGVIGIIFFGLAELALRAYEQNNI